MSIQKEFQGALTKFELTVYYEDTDAGGVVYHSNYLNFMERARSEWLNLLGWDVARCQRKLGIVFVVKSVEIDFNFPARLMDKLQVNTQVIQLGKVGITLQQDIYNQVSGIDETVGSSKPICSGFIRLATLDSITFKMKAMPLEIRDAINAS